MKKSKRTYLVGHFRHPETKRLRMAVVPQEDKDLLPPTMFEVVNVRAYNQAEARAVLRNNPQYCTHGRKAVVDRYWVLKIQFTVPPLAKVSLAGGPYLTKEVASLSCATLTGHEDNLGTVYAVAFLGASPSTLSVKQR